MKKRIILTALILSIFSSAVIAEDGFITPEQLEDFYVQFYEAPTFPIPEVKTKGMSQYQYAGEAGSGQNRKLKATPVFKKTRIKLTNFFREREYKRTQKLLEKEKQKEAEELKEENSFVEPVQVEDTAKDTLELEGGVREQVTSKSVQLDADKIDYDENTMDIIATGSPVLYFPPQETTIKAEKMVYNNNSNQLKAYGHVEVIRGGNVIKGEYMQINMNEENAFMDDIKTNAAFMTVTSRKADMDGDKITLYDGKMISENSYILNLRTNMVGGNNFNNMVLNDEEKSSINDTTGDTVINVKAKEVIVNAKKDHDTITFKKAQVRYGDINLFKIRSLTAHTNKHHDFFEANYPELGSRGMIGMFAGPGFVIDTPFQNGSTLKLIPFINNKDKFGVGAFFKYRSATNYTDFGYGSSKDVFILKGRQDLDDHLYLQYGVNSYLDEWFFGQGIAKYNAELIYRDQSVVPSTLGENLNLRFRQRASIGYMHDSDHNRHDEHIKTSNIGTMRARYMGELAQTLFNYEDRENKKILTGSLVLQGSAAVYGTGDTQFIGRIGPVLHSQYKYWMQDLGFYLSAYQDGTPLRVYDSYRYGHGSVYIREALRLCKYLTVAWAGTANVTGDAPNGKVLQENAFILSIGPDDFKINLGYDWTRRQTYFSFVIAMDTKGSSLTFDKMVIKNPDRLSKKEDEEVKLKVFDNVEPQAAPQPKKMKYAEVIEIEEPDRESIQ